MFLYVRIYLIHHISRPVLIPSSGGCRGPICHGYSQRYSTTCGTTAAAGREDEYRRDGIAEDYSGVRTVEGGFIASISNGERRETSSLSISRYQQQPSLIQLRYFKYYLTPCANAIFDSIRWRFIEEVFNEKALL